MKNKFIWIFLFVSILATTVIASAAVNDRDGDGIIDYLDGLPDQAKGTSYANYTVGYYWNNKWTTPTLTGYLNHTMAEIKTIEIFDQNGTSMGKQEFYIANRTHPVAGLIQVYFTKPGWNIYKMDFANPNLMDITYVPSFDYANFPLVEGKTWSYNLTQYQSNATINRSVRLTLEGTVIGKEKITTPAGTFDCIVWDNKIRNATTGNLTGNYKYWHSDSPNVMPKHEFYNVTTGIAAETWELISATVVSPTPTAPAPTSTKPAPGFELVAAAIGVTAAICLYKRRP